MKDLGFYPYGRWEPWRAMGVGGQVVTVVLTGALLWPVQGGQPGGKGGGESAGPGGRCWGIRLRVPNFAWTCCVLGSVHELGCTPPPAD